MGKTRSELSIGHSHTTFYTKSMFSYLFQMVQTSSYVLTLGFDGIIAFLIVGIVAMSGLQFTA